MDTNVVCRSCKQPVSDEVHCYTCNLDLHFTCAGITEGGYKKLGDERRLNWRCPACKQSGQSTPTEGSSSSADLTSILNEIKALGSRLTHLESIPQDVRAIRDELQGFKSSFEEINAKLQDFSVRIKNTEDRLNQLEASKKDQVNALQAQLDRLIEENHEKAQFSRMNNIEIKGVPQSKNENLLEMVCALGTKVQYPILKPNINFVTRVQSRDPNHIKPIIVCFNNQYNKENFIAAARIASKNSQLMASDLGVHDKVSKVFVNDHLTVRNKLLLNKVRKIAKEQNYEHIWVKSCKIFARKDNTSPILLMRSEKDLTKLI